jgi:DNA-binding NarL/FixJ family response regulator
MSAVKLRVLIDEDLLSNEEWQSIGCQLLLSGRELDILRCAVNGEKESDIACQLGISAHTVHTHLHRLFLKLGVSSRLEAIMLIFRAYIARSRQQGLSAGSREFLSSDRAA